MNKFVELQEVLPPSNCPIYNGSGMCMCSSMACDDVKDFHCASMRYAFTYGFNTMVKSANEMIELDNQKSCGSFKDVLNDLKGVNK